MGEKVPKKMNLKEIGIEKIILIAIAGIVLLLANFSEWKNAISEKTEKKEEKTVQTDQNDAYVSALENKLVHILENVDALIIDLYNLIPCLKPCLSCRRSCIYRSYDRFVYTDKADNNECTNKGKNKVKYRTCGNDRDPAPRRFAVEASL